MSAFVHPLIIAIIGHASHYLYMHNALEVHMQLIINHIFRILLRDNQQHNKISVVSHNKTISLCHYIPALDELDLCL